ncbi:MAG: hypothetical protein J6I45_00425 [Clostridia bacterium]|nr:hypothetical protein [Clostridia bacterium]
MKIVDIIAPAGGGVVRDYTQNGVTVYEVNAASNEGFSPDAAVKVKLELGEISGFTAITLYSPFWCRPTFGASAGDIPEKTQGLFYLKNDGVCGFILPLCDGDYVTSLEGCGEYAAAVVSSNISGLTECSAKVLIAAEGEDPYALARACTKEAANLLGQGLQLREERNYPEIFEYLGWCSWDAMEIWVNEEELLQKCEELRERKIPVRWAILDDMWAEVDWEKKLPRFTDHSISFGVMHRSTMQDYEADPEHFPHGLAGCIEKMKEYGLKIGLWHPTCGYWVGLTPGGKAASKLSGGIMEANGRILPDLSDEARAFCYYDTMHSFFEECGADFLKVDNQSFLRKAYREALPLGSAARTLHKAVEASIERHFGGALINCMGMASENMFSRRTSAVSRCSDDFKPENREWFAHHIMQCAYNGLLQGQYCVNDWDMWWSDDAQAGKNSLLRAISGGPIYVSDRLERSIPSVFEPLCHSDGRILRCDRSAIPSPDCIFRDPSKEKLPMKVVNTAGGTGYIAAFNLHTDRSAVSGSISSADIPWLEGDRFLLREHFSGDWQVIEAGEAVNFTLTDADDYRLWSLTPIVDGIAVIGDVTKFISNRAVCGISYEGSALKLTLYEDAEIIIFRECDGDIIKVKSENKTILL